MKVKFALVGCGGIAQLVHLPALRNLKDAELVAVCDIYEDVARKVAERYGVRKWYTDYTDMFEKEDIDAIVNTTWHAAHAKVTIDAANAGKHVFVEKPMAVTPDDCKEMIKTCEKNGVKLMVGFMKRFDPSLKWIKEEVEKGSFGEIFLINSWYYDTVMHRNYVMGLLKNFIRPEQPLPSLAPESLGDLHLQALLAHGVHHADLLRWIGGDIKTVQTSFKGYENGNYVSTSLIEYKNGTPGYLQLAGVIADDWDEGLIVKGTEGSVKANIRFPYFKWRSEATIYFRDRNEYVTKPFPCRDMYFEELKYFVSCITSGRDPKPNGYDGLKAQELIYAIHKSAKTGKKIDLSN